ncbi:hypothetical protein [Streptomyces tubercidicus]|uniref:hypothetical protein n=1 Tax=Streptomyces tubercidicus TaxID=47759 RepID=UPI0034655B65
MQQLELIVVQLEEAKALIEKERVAHLRLAFILLDRVTELILHRTVQAELMGPRAAARVVVHVQAAGGPWKHKGSC